jgi:hypothetical protein
VQRDRSFRALDDAGAQTGVPLALGMALAMVSAAALAYEILLTRLFAIIQWHHFAYMMISVALLGYGAAGTAVTLLGERLRSRLFESFAAAAAAFGLTSSAGFLAAQAVPFNALEFLWDLRQPLWLTLIYLLLFVPFFFAALCACLCFTRHAAAARAVYSFDILGAAAGSLGVILVLYVLAPMNVLGCVSALGLAAAALAWVSGARGPRLIAAVPLLAAIALAALLQTPAGQLRLSPYKQLSQAMQAIGARVLAERSSPLGWIAVVESPRVPLRHAPGLSFNAAVAPPEQLGIFTDGEGMSALNRFDGRLEALAYLDDLTSALAYHLKPAPRVLVLGAGAGADVLQALYHHAPGVDAVELNAQIVDLVQNRFASFSGKPYSRPGVRVHVAEARGFIARSRGHYDVIQIGLLDSFAASSAGLYALSENYLYTVEALRAYLERLAPQGLLSITRWVNLPPRDALKLLATAIVALERSGVADPGGRMMMIRSWNTATLLVKNGPVTGSDLERLRAFCRQRSFDLVWYPGMSAAQSDVYNRLEEPYFHEAAVALLGAQRAAFFERYKFDVRPATDDRPYFAHFFRWRTLPELLRLRERGGLPLIEWGYPLLAATLLQALVLGALFILLPLRRLRGAGAQPAALRARSALYFAAVGLGFMFIEIAFIQKFILFLSHPSYAVAVALFSFLLWAGVGSAASRRWMAGRRGRVPPVTWPVCGIAIACALYLLALPALTEILVRLPDAARIAAAILLIAPLGLCMGMPFPLGLEALSRSGGRTVPWAWGINACSSVAGAILATLLAIHFGFSAVILIAIGLYAVCAATFPAPRA